jgi:hypothetical protein
MRLLDTLFAAGRGTKGGTTGRLKRRSGRTARRSQSTGFETLEQRAMLAVVISQYVETNSGTTPKGIELWNPTASEISFSAENALTIEQGTNGGSPATLVTINSGSLPAGGVLVVGTSDMSPGVPYTFTFNGDDALVIKLAGVITDVFGTPGIDPGAAWTGGGVSTANQNIQLKTGITTGDLDGWADPSERFETVSTTPATLPAGLTGFGLAPGFVATDPTITAPGSASTLSTVEGFASASTSFAVTGANLTEGILATAPSGFEVSLDDTTFTSDVIIPQTDGNASATVYVRIAASAAAGPMSGNLSLTSAGATSASVGLSGSVRGATVAFPYGPQDFEDASSEPWFTYNSAGSANWTFVSSTLGGGVTNGPANRAWQANGFGSDVPADDWLMIGAFDFSSATNPVAEFSTLTRFTAGQDELFFKYSTDYTGIGDPSLATWTTVNFTRASSQLVMSPSGQVLLGGAAGQSSVFLAFHYIAGGTTSGTTAIWQVDDFEVYDAQTLSLSLSGVPATLNEGEFDILGTVSIPAPIGTNLDVTITSSDAASIVVDNGDFNQAATTIVTIFAGQTSATFYMEALEDGVPDADALVTITASVGDMSYDSAVANVTVLNIDATPVPLPVEGYTQDFATFAVETPDLPLGWSTQGLVTTFPTDPLQGVWGAGFNSGYRGGAEVFGYQHTGSTVSTGSPTFDKILTLQNDTGSTITDLTVAYTGRAERLLDGSATRFPAYTVTVDGNVVSGLAYSTGDGDGVARSVSLTGLSIAPGATFQIVWSSDRGTGSNASRQIGISDVSVTLGVVQTLPTVASLAVPTATLGRTLAVANASVSSDGGDTLSATGFVYIATADLTGELTLDTVGAVNVPESFAGVGPISESLSGLTSGTSYTIRAYATNSLGTAYTAARTFTTVNAPASFAGLYTQDFATHEGVLPTGWSAGTTNEANNYLGEWGTGSSAGFLGVGETETAGVLGYQHTTTSGQLTVTLSLVNDTGSTITELDVGYLGRVSRDTQTRTPEWTVTVAGNTVAELFYSTGNTEGEGGVAADLPLTASLTGLSIADGAEFTITWSSINESSGGGQTGSSRQIGIADVSVALPSTADPSIGSTGTLSAVSTTAGTASLPSTISVTGSDLTGVITATAPTGFEVSSDGVTYGPTATFTPASGAVSGTLSIRLAAATAVGSYSGDVTLSSTGADPVSVAMPASTVANSPVKVTGVFVRGSTWNSTYLDLGVFTTVGSDKLGYGLKDGVNQLATSGVNAAQVTWNNVNRISVRFDQPITAPAASALQLIRGDSGGDVTITPTSVSLLASGTVAQFSLPSSLVTGQYIISIGAGGIGDVAGTTVLDGEWTTSSSTFAPGSGDGTAGGAFNFRFNVLVGDVNASGGVNGSDRTATTAQLFKAMTTSNFRANVDGSASITGTDVTPVVSNLFRALGATPAIPATTQPAVTAATFAALGSTSAKLGGTVIEDGGSPVLQRGIIYVAGDTGSPQIGDPGVIQVLAAGSLGIFDVNVTGLSLATSYRFRAFVTTALGTAYSSAFTFTTLS